MRTTCTRTTCSFALAALLLAAGCRGGGSGGMFARAEPSLDPMVVGDGATVVADGSATPGESGPVVVHSPGGPPAANPHPIVSKPREFYERTPSNKLGKVAAATFVGVPAGVVGEVKQIFVRPSADTAPF